MEAIISCMATTKREAGCGLTQHSAWLRLTQKAYSRGWYNYFMIDDGLNLSWIYLTHIEHGGAVGEAGINVVLCIEAVK